MSIDWLKLAPRIAHDLRAQIRKALLNAESLQKLSGPAASPEQSERLRAIVESQKDLNVLVMRLLTLADAQTAPEERIDLATAVLAAKMDCRDAIQRAGAELRVVALPACSVPQAVQVVLRELIENSLRYRDPERSPEVVIGAEVWDGGVRVRVTDNGVGVDPAYVDKLFQPLQRLDAQRSGFGLGLAIARSLVESAGGSIYREPYEQGSSFVFELPCINNFCKLP